MTLTSVPGSLVFSLLSGSAGILAFPDWKPSHFLLSETVALELPINFMGIYSYRYSSGISPDSLSSDYVID